MRPNDFPLVVSAPSGTGKTTIIQRLMEVDDRFHFSISTTTRPRRRDEEQGRSYYYVTEEEFRRIVEQDGFIEWNRVHGNHYGITKKEIDRIRELDKIPIFDVDVQGADVLRGVLVDAVFVFIVPPSLRVLESRLRNRKTDSEEQIRIRLANSTEEIRRFSRYDYIVINESIETAVRQLRAIVTAELCRKDRIATAINSILEGIHDHTP
ncbi:MAG: guanylate kinase [Spirochaetes bacterium]|nr:guanylate kinase [Spirochaetota bacterium]